MAALISKLWKRQSFKSKVSVSKISQSSQNVKIGLGRTMTLSRLVFKQAWGHLRRARAHSSRQLRNLFQAWRSIQQFLSLIKTTRKRCRHLRRAKLLGILNDVRYSARNRDIQEVFKLVDRIAPKRCQGKPRVRDEQGMLLDVRQEAEANAQFLRKLYSGQVLMDPLLSGRQAKEMSWTSMVHPQRSRRT